MRESTKNLNVNRTLMNIAYSQISPNGKPNARCKLTNEEALTVKALRHKAGIMPSVISTYFPQVATAQLTRISKKEAYQGVAYHSRMKLPQLYYDILADIEAKQWKE